MLICFCPAALIFLFIFQMYLQGWSHGISWITQDVIPSFPGLDGYHTQIDTSDHSRCSCWARVVIQSGEAVVLPCAFWLCWGSCQDYQSSACNLFHKSHLNTVGFAPHPWFGVTFSSLPWSPYVTMYKWAISVIILWIQWLLSLDLLLRGYIFTFRSILKWLYFCCCCCCF